MKRTLAFLLMAIMVLSLVACGGGDDLAPSNNNPSSTPQTTDSDDSQQGENPSSNLQQDNVPIVPESNSTQSLFKTDYVPVASSQGYFIVRNESGNLYGLVDSEGTFVLPCEYEEISFSKAKSQTVLEIMSKGSYGIFDLHGNELIPCEYTMVSISPYHDSCIVETFVGKRGVLDFNGDIILPIEYDVLKFGYGKIFAAGKSANDQETGTVAAYDPDGSLIKDFPWNTNVADIVIGNGGNLLSVNYWKRSNYLDLEYLTIEGEAIWGGTKVVGKHIFFFQGNNLFVRDMDTQQEIAVWSFPEGRDSKQSDIRTANSYVDPINGVESVDLFVVGVMDDAPNGEGYYIRITFGEQIDTISYKAYDIVNTTGIGDWNNIGEFYDGVAMVFPESGYLYTIDANGEIGGEITKPYTNREKSLLLRNAAVLNNNGFYSIIDFDGNLLLSENGYSNVQKLNVNGIYVVTDQNGMLGLINTYAEELVPCGGITSIETAIKRPSNDTWDLESSLDAEDELYVIYKDNKWAVYSDSKCQLLTDFVELTGEHSLQHDCVLGNSGYALINEEADTAYLISYDGSSYEVSLYLDLT